MQSRKSVKSEEECLEKRIRETSDYVGLKETCPFLDQGVTEIHCRTDCAWYSDDACVIWDIAAALRRLSGNSVATKR